MLYLIHLNILLHFRYYRYCQHRFSPERVSSFYILVLSVLRALPQTLRSTIYVNTALSAFPAMLMFRASKISERLVPPKTSSGPRATICS